MAMAKPHQRKWGGSHVRQQIAVERPQTYDSNMLFALLTRPRTLGSQARTDFARIARALGCLFAALLSHLARQRHACMLRATRYKYVIIPTQRGQDQ